MYLLRSGQRKPSASNVSAVLQAAFGKSIRKTHLCALIKKTLTGDDGNRSGTGRELSGTDTEPISSTTGTTREQTGTGPEHHARVKTQDSKTKTHSPRIRVESAASDVTFGERERDVLSVLANDAGERKDGKIAESVLNGLRLRLAYALEVYGADAFLAGLQIALERGKGAAYAIGCMKRYKPTAAARPDDDDDIVRLPSSRPGFVREDDRAESLF